MGGRKNTPRKSKPQSPTVICIDDLEKKSCFLWQKHENMYLCSGSEYEAQNSLEQWCSITNHHSSLRD